MARARTQLIHCDNCGEDYAATYRRCPFCDAKSTPRSQYPADDYEEPLDDDEAYPVSRQGGKRLAGGGNRRGGGRGPGFWVRIGLYVLSAAVIIAALWVVCSYLFPKLMSAGTQESEAPASPSAVPSAAVPASPSPAPSDGDILPGAQLPTVPSGAVDDDPLSLDSPDLPSVEPDPISSQTPISSQAPVTSQAPVASTTPAPSAALKLSSTDFTLSPKYPTYQMEIDGVGRAQATYSMSNEAVATVSSNGLITAVANGNTKLTVTDKNGNTATAIVRVSGMSAQAPGTAAPAASEAPAQSQAPSGSASLNHTDFSITATYPDPVRLKVSGGEATGWSSSDGAVATVSENGTVTGVGNGTAKITCTLADGSKLTCTVYVSGK